MSTPDYKYIVSSTYLGQESKALLTFGNKECPPYQMKTPAALETPFIAVTDLFATVLTFEAL